jgi:hypothetical protein
MPPNLALYFVNAEVFEVAQTAFAMKSQYWKPRCHAEKLTDGLCVQVMHIGSCDSEPDTVAEMERFAAENGCAIDINDIRHHHEIYLGIRARSRLRS